MLNMFRHLGERLNNFCDLGYLLQLKHLYLKFDVNVLKRSQDDCEKLIRLL